ncbi:MAG: hypothetical protein HRU70_09265 [Phycisphaeraceae bacterium]|nr:MAG: hypothetical protein HRU70_09265 [Phycisphaeraceae bacterium]
MSIKKFNNASWLLHAAVVASAAGQPYTLTRAGFYDADHMRASDNNQMASNVTGVGLGGTVFGFSRRYVGFGDNGGLSAWVYRPGAGTVRVGLWGAEHVRQNGYQSSFIHAWNAQGDTAGNAERYEGGLSLRGSSAWVRRACDTATRDISLTDPRHTSESGYRESWVLHMSPGGAVLGLSGQYGGNWNPVGQTAWVLGTDNVREIVGLTDAMHTDPNGYGTSGVFRIIGDGPTGWSHASGTSSRILEGQPRGASAWIASPGAGSVKVGLDDPDHTSNTGLVSMRLVGMSDAGRLFGLSTRYRGTNNSGSDSAWLADPDGTTTRVGLHDAEHTASDGVQQTEAWGITPGGWAAGRNRRFEGTTPRGFSAWVISPLDGLRRVGLTDDEHTRLNGSRISQVLAVSDSGTAVGLSNRYSRSPDTQVGVSAFLDAPGLGSARVGLFDAEHTRADGLREVESLAITPGGLATGRSRRYSGTASRGWSAWAVRAGEPTRRLGFFSGPPYVHPDGSASSTIVAANDAGWIIGTSQVHGDFGVLVAAAGWAHHWPTNTTHELVLFVGPDRYTSTLPERVDERGRVFGHAMLINDDGSLAGAQTFVWTPDAGIGLLIEQVAGGLPADGIRTLSGVLASGDRFIAGHGGIEGYPGSGVFVLSSDGPTPCPADFDRDGFVDCHDLLAFLACFDGEACPHGASPDVNADGFVDYFDLDGFLDAFEAGC